MHREPCLEHASWKEAMPGKVQPCNSSSKLRSSAWNSPHDWRSKYTIIYTYTWYLNLSFVLAGLNQTSSKRRPLELKQNIWVPGDHINTIYFKYTPWTYQAPENRPWKGDPYWIDPWKGDSYWETTGELLVSGRVYQAIEVKPSTFWKITILSTENRAGPDNLWAHEKT